LATDLKHPFKLPWKRESKKKRRRIGIKWNLFLSFLAFSGVLLVLLWMFQTVFLDSFYRSIKTSSIQHSAQTIANNIDHTELDTLVSRIAQENDINIRIISEDLTEIASAEVAPSSIINMMPINELWQYYAKAAAANGSIFEHFDLKAFKDDRYDDKHFTGQVPAKDKGMLDTIIFARTVTLTDGTRAVILLNTTLTPITATVDTLRIQLLYITGILVVLSLLLALLMSRRVARPIIQINDTSKRMAKGDYGAHFTASGYKEIAELADTLNHTVLELGRVENLRRELIANISHDLRTPLTMISGYAEVMRDLPGENSPENVQVIIDESRRLTSLVNDILDLSKLQSGTQVLNLETYNLTDSIRSILQRYTKLTEQEGLKLVLEADQPAIVRADHVRVGQVLYNLINNAINYTGDDKLVRVRQTISGQTVRIEIIDSGEGIAPDQLAHIWDRYYKVDKVHKRAAIGNGLGLSIVKGILDLHKSRYGVESTVGQGSTFWFELPLA
jgi:signal transduction histidine kinase